MVFGGRFLAHQQQSMKMFWTFSLPHFGNLHIFFSFTHPSQNAELKFNFGEEDFKFPPKDGFAAIDKAPEGNVVKSQHTGMLGASSNLRISHFCKPPGVTVNELDSHINVLSVISVLSHFRKCTSGAVQEFTKRSQSFDRGAIQRVSRANSEQCETIQKICWKS